MNFLDEKGFVRRDRDDMFRDIFHKPGGPAECDRRELHLPRTLKAAQDIFRFSGGRQADGDIALASERFDLACEDAIKSVIISDCRNACDFRGQRYRRQRAPLAQISPDKLRREVRRVGRTAAVTEDENFSARCVRLGNTLHDRSNAFIKALIQRIQKSTKVGDVTAQIHAAIIQPSAVRCQRRFRYHPMMTLRPIIRAAALVGIIACGRSEAGESSVPAVVAPELPSSPVAAFLGDSAPLSPELQARMTGVSWHPGCPVPLSDLRLLTISHWGFDSCVHTGYLIVHRDVAEPVLKVMRKLFEARFPIRSMRLIDDFGGDDYASIEADNTSAFNCRRATASKRWSEHAYGRAIDINPLENPYVSNGRTSHPASVPYLDRENLRPGMAYEGGVLVKAFRSIGWGWGGAWPRTKDYQHFSAGRR